MPPLSAPHIPHQGPWTAFDWWSLGFMALVALILWIAYRWTHRDGGDQ